MLQHGVEPVIYYYNPNIWPREEYETRKNESKRHAESLGIQWMDDDELRMTDYELRHQSWRTAVAGLEGEPERGRRCEACFYHRLRATARKAQELGIPFFATTLASSRWKDLEQINKAGLTAERYISASGLTSNREAVPPRFWPQNWRKDGLQERRNELLKTYGFYNQTYCGCEYSLSSRTQRCSTEPADAGAAGQTGEA